MWNLPLASALFCYKQLQVVVFFYKQLQGFFYKQLVFFYKQLPERMLKMTPSRISSPVVCWSFGAISLLFHHCFIIISSLFYHMNEARFQLLNEILQN